MRRLLLLTFAASLLSAVACSDATSPPESTGPDLRAPQHTLVIPSTTPQVSSGGFHTCALKADGSVVCWGASGGDEFFSFGQATVPAALGPIAQVASGGRATCAIKTDGSVVCWGGTYDGDAIVPAGLTSVVQLSAGWRFTCALKTDGTVVCWGYGADGQTSVPDGLGPVTQISAGGQHICAVKIDATVACWGLDNTGQTDVPIGLASVAEVRAGGQYTCARKTNGMVVCWGDNYSGQTDVPVDLGPVDQLSVGSGSSITCVLKPGGTVRCWGDNISGGATVPAGLNSVVQISVGSGHACARKADQTVVCWGYNYYGQATVPAGLNLNSAPPVANAGGPYTGYEGTAVTFNGAGSSDISGQALTYSWDFGDGSALGSGAAPSHTYPDNGIYTVTLTVSNGITTSTAAAATATIENVLPAVGAIAGPASPVQISTNMTVTAGFTDQGVADTHTAVLDWGDGTSSAGTVTETNGSGSVGGSHVYAAAGVYTVTLAVTDKDAGTAQSVFEFVVVFDPAAGFVTGGGWVNSPAGAYAADISLSGKATFGFVSRYQKGATVPTGNTQFQFQTGNLHFRSTSYDWLVIAGPQVKFKGSGTINGSGNFGFMLSAVDGAVSGGGGTDKFRIKIWDIATGSVVYDNQMGATDDAAPTTAIGGGDVVIHK